MGKGTNKVPARLLNESAVSWSREQLHQGLRDVLELFALRLECSHDAAVHYVADRVGKSHNTVYSWLSSCDRHYPIAWPLLDLLRIELALMDSPKEIQGRFKGMLEAYETKWQSKHNPRKVVRRPGLKKSA